VSRFGGSGAVRIGVGHGMPRYEESATLDVPARRTSTPDPATAAAAEGPPPTSSKRILIVDQEPPIPPELVARLSKLSKRKRRRGPSSTIQGAALAIAVALLVVVLARQAGFGKHLGLEATDTSAPPAAVPLPAPPLALGMQGESRVTSKPHPAGSAKPLATKRSEPVTKEKHKQAPKQLAANAPARAESLPPIPYRVASSTPVQTMVPAATRGDDSPAGSPHKFGIIAGSFPSGDMAKAEKDHLARLVPYRVWVDKSKVQGVRTYQLMVGRFDTMEHAWDSAQTLMRRGLIRDANVRLLTEREGR